MEVLRFLESAKTPDELQYCSSISCHALQTAVASSQPPAGNGRYKVNGMRGLIELWITRESDVVVSRI